MTTATRTLIEGTLDELLLSFPECSITTFSGGEGEESTPPAIPPARRAKRSGDKLMPWQSPMPEPYEEEGSKDHAFRVFYSLLIRYGLRVQGQAGGSLSVAQIAERIEDYVDDAATLAGLPTTNFYEVGTGRDGKRGGFSEQSIERSVERAVQIVARDFDLAKYRMIQAQAAEAGRKGKSYTLDSFLETAHLWKRDGSPNVSAIARHLGIARNSVYAMLREFSYIDLDTGEIHDE